MTKPTDKEVNEALGRLAELFDNKEEMSLLLRNSGHPCVKTCCEKPDVYMTKDYQCICKNCQDTCWCEE